MSAEMGRGPYDRMFRLILSHSCCAPKAQHPTLFCSLQKVGGEMAWVECGGELGGTGEAEMGQTIGSISPDYIFCFLLPMTNCNPKILNGNFQKERTYQLQITLFVQCIHVVYATSLPANSRSPVTLLPMAKQLYFT